MANQGPGLNASAFMIQLSDNPLEQLNKKHTIFGEVGEGLEVLDKINKAYVDEKGKPYQVIRIKHTVIIDDPFDDIEGMKVPSRSPSPIVARKTDGNLSTDMIDD